MSRNKRKTARVVAEIGCNHKGDMAIAKEMIGIAATFAKCDYVKFQKRTNKELLSEDEYHAPHPNPANSYGVTYGKHREYLEFDLEQHRELYNYCTTMGIGYSTSVWDLNSARSIATLNPEFIKVPSACNLNFAMLEVLVRDYTGDIHISLGMTTPAETKRIVEFVEGAGAAHRVVLYACTSGYPVPVEETCMLEVSRLIDKYGRRVKEVGYSGHHLGIAIDMAAVTLGATWIERHYTLDRTWKGTDHAASLEPDGLRRLTRDVRTLVRALSYKHEPIMPVEQVQRQKLKRLPGERPV